MMAYAAAVETDVEQPTTSASSAADRNLAQQAVTLWGKLNAAKCRGRRVSTAESSR